MNRWCAALWWFAGLALSAGPPPGDSGEGVPPSSPAEGFGAESRGGEGGRTIQVTSLADRGPGTLREALAATGPRRIEFTVEGRIELQSRLRVTAGRVTLDGATAPGQGITRWNHGIQFVGDPGLGTRVHLSGNLGSSSPGGGEPQWAGVTWYGPSRTGWTRHRPAPAGFQAASPFAVSPVTTGAAAQALEQVLARAGAKIRDADDLRIIEEVRTRSGKVGKGPP